MGKNRELFEKIRNEMEEKIHIISEKHLKNDDFYEKQLYRKCDNRLYI
jgi:hypothetical protein